MEEMLSFSELHIEDVEEAFLLYRDAIGQPGCVWNDEYPLKSDLEKDAMEHCLFGLKTKDGEIVGAIARDRDPEIDKLACWNKALSPMAELARLVVKREYQNKGLAPRMITECMKVLKERGLKSVHYLVAVENKRARKSYEKLAFHYVGDTVLWGHDYLCYEKEL